jgi:hypothetical protein
MHRINPVEYPIIAPPFTLKFANMSKKELYDYFEWYIEQIAGRTPLTTTLL